MNTEMDLQDLSFPQNYASDSIIQLSASTIKQYSRNGQQCHLASSTPPTPSPTPPQPIPGPEKQSFPLTGAICIFMRA